MNQPWVYTCSPSWTPLHLFPYPIPQSCPRETVLSALFHTSNLDWWSLSHMVIYMFQCCSLKSSHPRLLPQNPKVCSLYLCLFYCLTCRFSLIQSSPPITLFVVILSKAHLSSHSRMSGSRCLISSVLFSSVAQSCLTLCNLWTVAHQAAPSMGFSRQEYWSGLPFPSPNSIYMH